MRRITKYRGLRQLCYLVFTTRTHNCCGPGVFPLAVRLKPISVCLLLSAALNLMSGPACWCSTCLFCVEVGSSMWRKEQQGGGEIPLIATHGLNRWAPAFFCHCCSILHHIYTLTSQQSPLSDCKPLLLILCHLSCYSVFSHPCFASIRGYTDGVCVRVCV